MRHLALALACVAVMGSLANGAPAHRGKRHGKVARKAKHRAPVAPPLEDGDTDTDRIAFRDDAAEPAEAPIEASVNDPTDDDSTEIEAPVKLHERAKPRGDAWHVAIGPYLWASAVDANVSLGSANVGSSIDFTQMKRHAQYGAEVLSEVRHGRFSFSGDLMYGLVSLTGDRMIGPLMVTVEGTASTTLVDGMAGYQLAGNDDSLLSLEARAGVRYQRTAIAGSVGIGGSPLAGTNQIIAGADALAGARVFVRPSRYFYVSGSLDLGMIGDSATTWSASADASARVTSHLLLSVGWRTLTLDGTNVSMVMHGPRAAIQLLF